MCLFSDPDIVYETPIRVIAPASGGTITFCDYMFQDEAATDAAERFRDLLNLSVEPDNIAMNLERIPSETFAACSLRPHDLGHSISN